MLEPDEDQAQEWESLRAAVEAAEPLERARVLGDLARRIRVLVVHAIDRGQLGHIGGDFSVTDVLATLYGAVLRVDPLRPAWPERDRLVLSKGHCAASLYSVLALSGFFSPDRILSFCAPLSELNGHPNRTEVPGVETNTGPLGHGFPVAVGHALGARLQGSERRTFVILGDGESQEGSNWEAAMYAGNERLSALTAIVDYNGLQQGASVKDTNDLAPLADKWRAFNWNVVESDGHDYNALLESFGQTDGQRPTCVIAHTIKGRGVSFMENQVGWHHRVPDDDEVRQILAELER